MSLTAELFGAATPSSTSPSEKLKKKGTSKNSVVATSTVFEPTKKAAFDIFAVAPEVRKATRREKQRLRIEEGVSRKNGTWKGKGESATEDEIFRTVIVDNTTGGDEVGESKPHGRKKQLRHALHQNEEEDSRTVFVGNLVNDVKRRVLEKVFKTCGPIESVRIRAQALEGEKDLNGGEATVQPKGVGRAIRVLRGDVKKGEQYSAVAYVLFKDKSSIKEALDKNGVVVEGRHIVVTTLDPEGREYAPETSVFVGNVAYDSNEEALWNFFVEKGIRDVKRVRLVRDRESGMCKGFGYVEFQSKGSVAAAIALRGTLFMDREIRIVHVQKSKAVTASKATRREKRKLGTRGEVTDSRSQGAEGNGKRMRTEGKTKVQGPVDDQPPWMGVVTNPRRKIPKDLRPLVEGKKSFSSPAPRAPVKRKMRNPEKGH
ncbi:Double RNA binding domain protein 9 [Trypanosoma equiperdum]|uniref:Double RNA binding domain protein 9 n=1 Tax=Trypanosoma equiperdum TaxID=5694 RepID=A0A1G4IHC7_TRYEQ|nr:Double RNA binding domain protein 9 [Trypanosoma equiperdum]